MASNQTTSPLDVLLDLTGPGPAHVRLTRALRDGVHDGRLPPGVALPSSRALAQTLGVSRWVVTQAYEELVAEGVLVARTGSATRVASGRVARGAVRRERLPAPPGRWAYDLGPGVPDVRHLPLADWVRAVREATDNASTGDLLSADPAGHPGLRDALADRLAAARAVRAGGADVVVTHGSADGMRRLARALVAAGHRAVLVEDPSWPRLRDVCAAAGLVPVPVPVDAGGVDVGALAAAGERSGARVALVAPAHQFPVGVALAPARREALVTWADAVDGLVVEDDYDAEFRYDRRPVAALQGLAPGRVVLLGSLSKTLVAAFGLGWLVLPPAWRDAVLRFDEPPPPTLHQLAVGRLLTGGAYDRHLRAARTRYRRRQAALLDALAAHLPDAPCSGLAAGLHLVLRLPPGVAASAVVAAAERRDVRVVDLQRYRASAGAPAAPALVLGYGNLVDARLEEAVTRLAAAVRDADGPAG